jgi:hypothetical protein
MSVAHRQDSRLPNNHSTGDASPGVAGGISHVIVRPCVDDECRAGGMEQEVRPRGKGHSRRHHSYPHEAVRPNDQIGQVARVRPLCQYE